MNNPDIPDDAGPQDVDRLIASFDREPSAHSRARLHEIFERDREQAMKRQQDRDRNQSHQRYRGR